MKYDFISDPGHGWLKVKRSVAQARRVEKIERSLAFCQAATANALGSAA